MKFPQSDRLVLRPLSEEDATQEYANWLNDPEVNRFLEVRHSFHTVENCRSFIDQMNADPNQHLFGVFLKSNGRHIGNAKIGFIKPEYASGELSLLIGDRSSWGCGYGREIVRALTSYGFNELGLERIEAGCYESNFASLKIFLKVGYAVEGFFRESVLVNEKKESCFWLGILKKDFK